MLPSRCAVLFDLYGALADLEIDEADPVRWQRMIELTRREGLVLPGDPVDLRDNYRNLCAREAADETSRRILDEVFGTMVRNSGESADEAARTLARAFREVTVARLELRPYTLDLLETLRQSDVLLGLVSNTEAILTHYDLELLELTGFFDALVLSSEAGEHKPHAAIFDIALGRLAVSSGRAVMVGDTYDTDIRGARAAGIPGVHLDPTARPGSVRAVPGEEAVAVHPDRDSILLGLRAWGVLLDGGGAAARGHGDRR